MPFLGPLRSLVAGNCFLGLIRDSGGLIIEENEESIERQVGFFILST
jgi:hypothetical protein